VVVIAGRFDLAGTWDTLMATEDAAVAVLEPLAGLELPSTGRVGPVEAAGVDYLAAVIELTMYRN
jgi:hypothetical protein